MVSNDTDLLSMSPWRGTPIIEPAAFAAKGRRHASARAATPVAQSATAKMQHPGGAETRLPKSPIEKIKRFRCAAPRPARGSISQKLISVSHLWRQV